MFIDLLRKIAAARGGEATIVLVTESGELIPCRDVLQAQLIERLWLAFWQNAKPPNR